MPPVSPLRQVLISDELLDVPGYFSISVADARAKAPLLGTFAGVEDEWLAEASMGFTRDRLKKLCWELLLDDSGKVKPIIDGQRRSRTRGNLNAWSCTVRATKPAGARATRGLGDLGRLLRGESAQSAAGPTFVASLPCASRGAPDSVFWSLRTGHPQERIA